MPSRMACVAILSFWVYAAFGLFRRDILPDLVISPPPDLRSVAVAEVPEFPTRWDIQVADDATQKNYHSIGQAITRMTRSSDGTTELTSEVRFDSGRWLKGMLLTPNQDERYEIDNVCQIDATGNLLTFRATCKAAHDVENMITLDGRVQGTNVVVKISSLLPLPLLNQTLTIPYTPRSMVQNAVGPIDRMPGLQVGQRWESRVVSPLMGRVEVVTVEVTGKHAMHWGNGVVTVLEVVHHLSPTLTARTWVRRDGLVLRQEVPLPFAKVFLERIPGPGDSNQSEAKNP